MNIVLDATDGKTYTLPVMQNNNLVNEVINKHNHPHPVLIAIIIIIVIIMMYCVYISQIKKCFSETWYNKDSTIKIIHNKWTDTLKISIQQGNNVNVLLGYTVGNALYMTPVTPGEEYEFMGIFKDDVIYWLNGDIWRKQKIAI